MAGAGEVGGGGTRRLIVAMLDFFGEVEFGFCAFELEGCFVVSKGRILCGVEGAEPDSGCFLGVADFGRPFAPWSLPHSSVVSFPGIFLILCCDLRGV